MRPLWPSAAVFIASVACALSVQAEPDPLSQALGEWNEVKTGNSGTAAPAVSASAVSSYVPVPAEAAHPDDPYENHAFRKNLLRAQVSDFYRVTTELGGIYLVVKKGYLNEGELKRLTDDLILAVHKIPEITERSPVVTKRFTVYVYPGGPRSEADVPGAQPGETGLMLNGVKEDEASIFHEMTHLLAEHGHTDGHPDGKASESLSEGIASYIQAKIQPGKAANFIPANVDLHQKAEYALSFYLPRFFERIGAPGSQSWAPDSPPMTRIYFYYCSWSFVDFLIRNGGMERLWSVIDADETPAVFEKAYVKAYGKSRTALIADWKADVSVAAAANP